MSLPEPFLRLPLAHRGLHDADDGIIENSASAFDAAVAAGYGIELDVQFSADGVPLVFHDDALDRLTDFTGLVRDRIADDLRGYPLTGGGGDAILSLADALDRIGGRVPVLIEIKDQGAANARLDAIAADLRTAPDGPVAIMSFNPDYVTALAGLAPDVPRGLTTCAFAPDDWPAPPAALERLRAIADFDAAGASFVSHDRRDLDRPRVAELRQAGAAILTWTVRSAAEEEAARSVAHNFTFEGYRPAIPA